MHDENKTDDRSASWRGLEPLEPQDQPIRFHPERGPLEKLDLTPMADVTFLLLIFFMITASFAFIRRVEQPLPIHAEGNLIPQDEHVECIVDQHDTFHFYFGNQYPEEAGSVFEMQRLLREALEQNDTESLVIITHEKSSLKKMMAVYSTGATLGFESIQLVSTDVDY